MAEEFADKTEAPTPYRRAEARREGRVAQPELSAAVLCLAVVMLLHHCGPGLVNALKLLLAESISTAPSAAPAPAWIGRIIGIALAPLAAGVLLIVITANVLQTGFIFRPRKNGGTLNPIAGLERMFSGRSFVGLAMSVAKLLIVAIVVVLAIRSRAESLVALQGKPAGEAIAGGMAFLYAVALRAAGVLIVLALLDYVYQRHCHERELRMTRREVKDEMRRQQGDPVLKGRRRGIADAWALSPLQRDVAAADVVITGANDRTAVALRFDAASMAAPRLLARGHSLAAKQIREAALQHGVAMIERSDLAVTMARAVGVGRDVPTRFHKDLADVFAYAYELKGTPAL